MDIKFNGKKSPKTQSLICSILDVLESVGVSFDNTSNRMKEQMALCCLALSGIHEKLNNVSKISPLTTKQIISKWNEEYEDNMSLGSYDSVRDGAIKKLMGNGLIIKEQAESTNSSTAGYYLYPRFVELLTVYESEEYSILLEEIKEELKNNSKPINLPKDKSEYLLQQIFYGAPGTGKSHTVEQVCKQYKHHRTTFHPDSDYSTFVGCYKPTMLERKNCMCNENIDDEELGNILLKYKNEIKPTYNAFGKFGYDFYEPLVKNNTDIKKLVKNVLNKQIDNFSDDVYIKIGMELYKNKSIVNDKFISYSFVPQTFIQSYTEAWQYPNESVFLVIEEINRGNCAQIFGDIFQLLDRNDEGWSSYAIDADKDLQGYLCDYFAENGISENAPEDIKSGKKLLLPPNLHIWATMNTSDQSLFPIDSAFKRRWDWKYIKITNGYKKDDDGKYILDADKKKIPLGWTIEFEYDEEDTSGNVTKTPVIQDWWLFIQQINKIISSMTSSADKQLGYFFCKAKDGKIDAETFVGKVAFYLWNDVFKDYAMDEGGLFKYKKNANDNDSNDLTFPNFYDEDGDVDTFVVKQFIDNVMQWKDSTNSK